MLPSARAITVASIVVLLSASGGDLATAAGGPGSAGGSAAGPRLTLTDIWGYGVVRDPSFDHTLAHKDAKNSAGTASTMTRFGPGNYFVQLPGMDAAALNAGTTLVSPLNAHGDHVCVAAGWGWHTPDPAEIDVKCYDRSGRPTDSAFSTSLIDAQSLTGKSGYVWANDPTNVSYVPDPSYQYNSTGATNTIERVSAGRYAVFLPDLATARGNVQVANGFLDPGGPAVCRILSWGPSVTALVVNVQCRDLAGAKADATFNLFFAQGQGLKGPGVGPAAYLDADHPTTASYAPDPLRTFSTAGMAPHVARTGLGRYLVTLPGMPVGGAAQVTAYGSGKSRCVLSSIATSVAPQQIGVHCFAPNGDRVDSEFGLSYQR